MAVLLAKTTEAVHVLADWFQKKLSLVRCSEIATPPGSLTPDAVAPELGSATVPASVGGRLTNEPSDGNVTCEIGDEMSM